MNAKLLAWIALPILGLIVAGIIVANVISWLLGWVFYLALGVAVVGLGLWGYSKVRGKLSSGSQRRMLP
ncbi:hypothetical protein [Stackebrandtia soli]|uniref:hypothetical protein n=1 Tax=Stackebrandtia soli TaxID=1892856 RepID=UPI0039E9CD6B